jgi:hypothetical protein
MSSYVAYFPVPTISRERNSCVPTLSGVANAEVSDPESISRHFS